jgi:hypothetical protein
MPSGFALHHYTGCEIVSHEIVSGESWMGEWK